MNNVTTATSLPSLCRQHGQHGRKCEAQDISWSRTNKQLEAWLRPRPRITGGSAEKLAIVGEASACWVQYITTTAEGGTMYRSREGFSFFLANSHNREEHRVSSLSVCRGTCDELPSPLPSGQTMSHCPHTPALLWRTLGGGTPRHWAHASYPCKSPGGCRQDRGSRTSDCRCRSGCRRFRSHGSAAH